MFQTCQEIICKGEYEHAKRIQYDERTSKILSGKNYFSGEAGEDPSAEET
jgi:hypothetical protein